MRVRRLLFGLLAVAVLCIAAETAEAAFAADLLKFDGSVNRVNFRNYEHVLRATNDAADGQNVITLGGSNYRVVTNTMSIEVGDLFVQLYRANEINFQTGFDGEFVGYAVQQVETISVNSATDVDIRFKAASVDPFGVFSAAELADGAMLALYADTNADFTDKSPLMGGDLATGLVADVATVTNGVLWSTFGIGSNIDGILPNFADPFFRSKIDPTKVPNSGENFNFGDSYTGLNRKSYGSLGNGVVFTGVRGYQGDNNPGDDPLQSIRGQAELFANRFDPFGDTEPTDYRFFVDGNGNSNGTSNWLYASDDPFEFRAVPEPGAVAVWGVLAVVGVLGVARRRACTK